MTQATVGFLDANGNWVPVTANAGLPISGAGGGGAVDSVNGQTGEVEITLNDLVDGTTLVDGGTISVVNDGGNPTQVASIYPLSVSVTDYTSGESSTVEPGRLTLTDSSGHSILLPGAGAGNLVSLPSESGTLALTSDTPDIPDAPPSGTYTLQSEDGVLTWVAAV